MTTYPTYALNDEEREMIATALRTYESEFNSQSLSAETREYFAKALALADRFWPEEDDTMSDEKTWHQDK